MKYEALINGIDVKAEYSDESVSGIFIPLLHKLRELQQKKQSRVLVFLAAPPAAGKSTMVSFLEELAKKMPDMPKVNTIGMDGFHRYQDYLLTHTLMRDGEEIRMVDVKGTPETFDLELLSAYIQKAATGARMKWPAYDRMLHNPIQDVIEVDADIVILEGNYLLLDLPGWRDLKQYADYTIGIVADEQDLKERLVARKTASGTDLVAAEEFVERSDLYNARLCLQYSMEADLILKMKSDGEYVLD